MRSSTLHCWLALLIAAAAVCCTGCFGHRYSDEQAQTLANARAGAMAAQKKREAIAHEPDPVQANLEAQALLDDLTRGLIGFTLASTANLELPAPTFQPAVLLEQPDQAFNYGEKGIAAAIKPPKSLGAGFWASAGLAALGAVGVALKLGRNVPGVGGTVAALLGPIWDHFVSDKVKDKEDAIDDGLTVAIAYGERLAHVLTNAGFAHLVEDAKLRAMVLAERLGANDEIKRRLALARSGKVALASLPADSRPAQAPVTPG